jgi:hypothetical protein
MCQDGENIHFYDIVSIFFLWFGEVLYCCITDKNHADFKVY